MSRSLDGGFARETLMTDPSAGLEQRDADVVVHTDAADYVLQRGHGLRRVAR